MLELLVVVEVTLTGDSPVFDPIVEVSMRLASVLPRPADVEVPEWIGTVIVPDAEFAGWPEKARDEIVRRMTTSGLDRYAVERQAVEWLASVRPKVAGGVTVISSNLAFTREVLTTQMPDLGEALEFGKSPGIDMGSVKQFLAGSIQMASMVLAVTDVDGNPTDPTEEVPSGLKVAVTACEFEAMTQVVRDIHREAETGHMAKHMVALHHGSEDAGAAEAIACDVCRPYLLQVDAAGRSN